MFMHNIAPELKCEVQPLPTRNSGLGARVLGARTPHVVPYDQVNQTKHKSKEKKTVRLYFIIWVPLLFLGNC